MKPSEPLVIEVFSQISPDDEQVLTSLPYRIGLYVSYADITGGWEAQEKERLSLTSILQQFSQDFYKTEFTQKVLMDALAARSNWPALSKDIEKVPAEADYVCRLLTPIFESGALHSFKSVLVDIAITVAMAFREAKEGGEDAAPKTPVVRDLLSRFLKGEEQGDPLDHVNISQNEKSAIRALMAALDYGR